MIRPGSALCVFAIIASASLAMAALMPVSILLIVSCTVALVQYSVCFLVNDLADEYVLVQEN